MVWIADEIQPPGTRPASGAGHVTSGSASGMPRSAGAPASPAPAGDEPPISARAVEKRIKAIRDLIQPVRDAYDDDEEEDVFNEAFKALEDKIEDFCVEAEKIRIKHDLQKNANP